MNKGKEEAGSTYKKRKIEDHHDHSQNKNASNQKKHYSQTIFRNWCKRCGICSAFCPKKVISCDDDKRPVFEHPEDCIGCRFCELHCPDFAITIKEYDPSQKEEL
ncbi:MAG: 4Fe-4S binding protein [Thermodesulfobacteriota bacterium]|nr:4Fe-4S binding protein [Thermodesulfobacteriota bacterium]